MRLSYVKLIKSIKNVWLKGIHLVLILFIYVNIVHVRTKYSRSLCSFRTVSTNYCNWGCCRFSSDALSSDCIGEWSPLGDLVSCWIQSTWPELPQELTDPDEYVCWPPTLSLSLRPWHGWRPRDKFVYDYSNHTSDRRHCSRKYLHKRTCERRAWCKSCSSRSSSFLGNKQIISSGLLNFGFWKVFKT